MRECHFCDNAADSKEHAWPKWLASRFGSSSSVLDVRIGDQAYVTRSKYPVVTVRSVCRECNNGWMSRLEDDARPALELLLGERNARLDVQEMHLVSAWALKTSMVFESVDRANADFYTRVEREAFRRFMAIPEYTWIWVAGVRGFDAVFTDAHRLSITPTMGASDAVLTTLAFGNFAAQVLTLRPHRPEQDRDLISFETRAGPWVDIQLAVWPHRLSGARWPMPVGLAGREGVELWASRFSPAMKGT
jgi:hypothetical protein